VGNEALQQYISDEAMRPLWPDKGKVSVVTADLREAAIEAMRPFVVAAMRGGGSVNDCIRAALAAADAAAWRPISEAPKDGTSILVYRVNTKLDAAIQPISTDWWSTHHKQWMKSNAYSQPTHWMPLPAPPAKEVP
jgi:hypothetical protein